jgi:enamine deaminase RidA (YjgF/YER057c/UK114 family)
VSQRADPGSSIAVLYRFRSAGGVVAAATTRAYAGGMQIQRFEVGPRMSQVVVCGDRVSTAGLVADDPVPSVTAQTRQVLAKLERLLALAGSSKDRLIKVNIWLANVAAFDELNAVWDAWVVPGATPARATVESRLAGPYLVEIMAEALAG